MKRFFPCHSASSLTTRLHRLLRSGKSMLEYAVWTLLLSALATPSAHAQDGTDPTEILEKIAEFIIGPFGQSLAILGIVAIGLSWMFGRASLGLIAGVVGGIVIMFGASYLVDTVIAVG